MPLWGDSSPEVWTLSQVFAEKWKDGKLTHCDRGSWKTGEGSKVHILLHKKEILVLKFALALVLVLLMFLIPGANGYSGDTAAAEDGRVARLSRGSSSSSTYVTWPLLYDKAKLCLLQLQDPDLSAVLRWMEQESQPFGQVVCQSSPTTRHYWNQFESLLVQDGVLFRKFIRKDGSGAHLQLLVPAKLREDILCMMHDSKLSGHLGKKKTHEKTLQRYYWFGWWLEHL